MDGKLLTEPEGMKTVTTSRPCRDLHWAVLFLLGAAGSMSVGYEQMGVVRAAAKQGHRPPWPAARGGRSLRSPTAARPPRPARSASNFGIQTEFWNPN